MSVVIVVFAVPEQFFGVVECVDSWLSSVEVWWGDPFGLAVGVGAGGPALFGELVIGMADQGEAVDIGDGVFGVGVVVVDLAQVTRDGAAGEGAAAVLGVQHNPLGR